MQKNKHSGKDRTSKKTRSKGRDVDKARRRIRRRESNLQKMPGTILQLNHGSGPTGRKSKNQKTIQETLD
jgi:hypothetical protein